MAVFSFYLVTLWRHEAGDDIQDLYLLNIFDKRTLPAKNLITHQWTVPPLTWTCPTVTRICPEKMCEIWVYGDDGECGGCSSIQFRPKSKHSVMFLRHKQSTSGFDVSDITAEKMPVARKTEVIFFNFRRHHNPVRSHRLDKDLTGIFAVTFW